MNILQRLKMIWKGTRSQKAKRNWQEVMSAVSNTTQSQDSFPHGEGVRVPLRADAVAAPLVRYGDPFTAIFFAVDDRGDTALANGMVTFEGLDSIRCSRGEFFPYQAQDWSTWVYQITPSPWLNERHDYELRCYDTSLLEEYRHFLFTFHDHFIEVIAKGLWVEGIATPTVDDIPQNHPLLDLPESLTSEPFVLHTLCCELRRNPLPLDELVMASKLCSQKLFQFYLKLDETGRSASYSAELRTIGDKSVTRLRAGWPYPDRAIVDGVANVEQIMPAWDQYVRQVADRRKAMGKSD